MLDGDHARLVQAVLPVCAKYGLALAGGYAIKAHHLVDRKDHLLVSFADGATSRVDVLKEPLNHPLVMMEFGPVIALQDAVALKMGALHDRALPRDLLDAYGASAHFSGPELISLCRGALDDEFRLDNLRDQLGFAAMYPDEAFSRYGADPSVISAAKAWAQEWSTRIALDLAEAEPWSEDSDWTDDE